MTNSKPTLNSCKPSKARVLSTLGISALSGLFGIGLFANAVYLYQAADQDRISQKTALEDLQRDSELRQTKAQLDRSYDAPVWAADNNFDPRLTYEMDGTREIEVPVLMGINYDEAVCIGTMGPEGFVQNPDHELCFGY